MSWLLPALSRHSATADESVEYRVDEYDDELMRTPGSRVRDRVADVAYPDPVGLVRRAARPRGPDGSGGGRLSVLGSLGGRAKRGRVVCGPATLPTYVDAPRATRVRRPIERDRDWSGEAMVEVARTMRRPRITVDDLEDDRYELRSTPRDVASSEDTAELPSLGYEETRRAAGE